MNIDTRLEICHESTKEVVFSLKQLNSQSVAQNAVLSEVDKVFFSLKIHRDHAPSNVVLKITDIFLEPVFYDEDKYIVYKWKSPNKNTGFFQNLAGEARLEVLFSNSLDEAQSINFGMLEILPSKATKNDIINMLKYIAEGVEILEEPLHLYVARSATRFIGFEDIIGRKSFLERLKMLEKCIATLKLYIPNIFAKPIANLTTEHEISYFDNKMDVDIDWALDNIYSFSRTSTSSRNSFFYNGYNFEQKIYRNRVIKNNYNVYENQIILQFISSMINFCYDVKKKIRIPHDEIISESLNRKSLFEIIKSEECKFYNNFLSSVNSSLLYLESIKKTLISRFSVQLPKIHHTQMTAKIKENFYYRTIFEHIYMWNNKSKSTPNADSEKNEIKTLDKVYEVFCWFRIYFTFLNSGFKISERFESSDECLSILFENSTTEVEFSYEPRYFSYNKSSLDNYLNIEKWNSNSNLALRKNNSFRSPDFVFTITDKNTKYQYLTVLDAKYTSAKNAFKTYLPDCTLKYIHGIGSRDVSKYSPVKALYILFHGEMKDRMSSQSEYHYVQDNFNLYSDSPTLPQLGCVHFSITSKLNYEKFILALISMKT